VGGGVRPPAAGRGPPRRPPRPPPPPPRPPHVELDSAYFKLVGDFEQRFAAGPPSLAGCTRLEVEGDVSFGRDVVVRGSVRVEGPRRIEDGSVLQG
jgi:UTP--glucose-1-phosphate uridylyltransferase